MNTHLLKLAALVTMGFASTLGVSRVSADQPTTTQAATVTVAAPGTIDAMPVSFHPDWRYRWHNNHWWYWMPSNTWVIWYNGGWIPYDANTYYSYYPSYGYDSGYYAGDYYNSYPSYGYYGGYGYPYYGGGVGIWYGDRDRGWRGGRGHGWNQGRGDGGRRWASGGGDGRRGRRR